MSSTASPHSLTRSSMIRLAMRTLWSAVRAWPSSSMHMTTTAAPCSRTTCIFLAKLLSGPLPSLVVPGVDDAAPAETFQAGLDDLPLGGVDHQRQGRRG